MLDVNLHAKIFFPPNKLTYILFFSPISFNVIPIKSKVSVVQKPDMLKVFVPNPYKSNFDEKRDLEVFKC